MATGNIVPRKRKINPNWSRKQGKVCPHPDCDTVITDNAITCAEHRRWYEREMACPSEKKLAIHRAADRAMGAGVPYRVVLIYTRRWHEKAVTPTSIQAQIEELICGYS